MVQSLLTLLTYVKYHLARIIIPPKPVNSSAALKHPGFEGVLLRASLNDIIQMECLSMHASMMQVDRDEKSGCIYFAKGQVVHAQVSGLVGEDAFFEILSWNKGAFHMEEGVRAIEETITRSWENLLIEAAHLNDEQKCDATVTAFPLPETLMPNKSITDAFTDPQILDAIYLDKDGTLLDFKGDDPETLHGTFAYIMQLLQHVGTALGADHVREVQFVGTSQRALCITSDEKTIAVTTTTKVNLTTLSKKLATP